MSKEFDIYTGMLKVFPLPSEKIDDITFLCNHNHPQLDVLKKGYPIEFIAGSGNDFSKAVNLLKWVSANSRHKGDFRGNVESNAIALLNYSFGKGEEGGINCVGLATILAECLLAVGVAARKVFIMPCSPYDGDNHVVTHAYIRELNKWVMFDPTWSACVSNEKGEYLSLLELRGVLSNQEDILLNEGAGYNGKSMTEKDIQYFREYFAKNLFYLQTSEVSTFNDDAPNNRFITLCPHGFSPQAKTLNNIEYRMKKYAAFDDPFMLDWKKGAEKDKYFFCSVGDFE